MVPLRCRVAVVSLPGAAGGAAGRPQVPPNPGVHPAAHGAAGAPGDAPGSGKKHTGVDLWTHRGGYVPVLHSRGAWGGAKRRHVAPELCPLSNFSQKPTQAFPNVIDGRVALVQMFMLEDFWRPCGCATLGSGGTAAPYEQLLPISILQWRLYSISYLVRAAVDFARAQMGYGLPATCPSAHTGDTPKSLCTAMCQPRQATVHCTWCKCY